MTSPTLQLPRVSGSRLTDRLDQLARVGDTGDGGCCRLALTDEDRAGRDLVVGWMRDLGLDVTIDAVGNAIAVQTGHGADPPVMCGSHIDTVATGGRFDGNLGVLAGLEVIETAQESGISLERPLAVGFFTNEEGARFAPDMLGSLVYAGGLTVDEARAIEGFDGAVLGDELDRIGYAGAGSCPGPVPHAFVELHIEQGPVLEASGIEIGAVTGVQGISWQELTITGQSNHAGTTPMSMRHDAAFAAASITTFVRELALEFGGTQVATVGSLDLHPGLVNVVAASAGLTVDLRNTDDSMLDLAEERLAVFLGELSAAEGVAISVRPLARFAPVEFDERVIAMVEEAATGQGRSVVRLASGAGHDAQMFARICPTAMIFVPSVGGVSHNPREFTSAADLESGANMLLDLMVRLSRTRFS